MGGTGKLREDYFVTWNIGNLNFSVRSCCFIEMAETTSFSIVYGCFQFLKAELCCGDRNYITCKA